MNYCEYCLSLPEDNPHCHYHDALYGFPIADDNELFGRLLLEINQAGLSWDVILRKEAGFRRAYSGFDIAAVADYAEADCMRLMTDAGIIRNRLKIAAAVYNAQQILELQAEYGSFKNWLDAHHPRSQIEWLQLFRKCFKFVGSEIVGEFLMSIGYLRGAHMPSCPAYAQVLMAKPAWYQGEKGL